jgi:hypothetical protein
MEVFPGQVGGDTLRHHHSLGQWGLLESSDGILFSGLDSYSNNAKNATVPGECAHHSQAGLGGALTELF